MSILLKYIMVFAMVLIGIIAFSVCAECPLDACMQAFCAGADGSKPLGRLGSGPAGVFLAALLGLGVLAVASLRFPLAVASFVRVPALLRASSLRI